MQEMVGDGTVAFANVSVLIEMAVKPSWSATLAFPCGHGEQGESIKDRRLLIKAKEVLC